MELSNQRVELPRENIIEIRGTRFIVTSHYNDAREPLKEIVIRLLQENVESRGLHI